MDLAKADTFAQQPGIYLSDDEPSNQKPFSSQGGLNRVFIFPTESLGQIRMAEGPFQHATTLIAYRDFTPLQLVASAYLFKHPHLINRFRSDELGQVDLQNCDENLGKILENLVRMKSLRNLNLTDSTVNDSHLPIIGEMSGLAALNLTGSRLTGAALAKLKNLRQLEALSCTQVADPKPLLLAFQKMPQLKVLDFSRANVDESDVLALSKIKTLTRLDVTGEIAVNDKTIVHFCAFPSLVYLDIEFCPITAKSIPSFKKMHALRQLHLSPTGWTDKQKLELAKAVGSGCEINWSKKNPGIKEIDNILNDVHKYSNSIEN
ncbi:hypothetical protein BH10CYA1_BH10CYA1_30940 [soil metagenome]